MSQSLGAQISIPGYNASNRVPGVFNVIDASKANTAVANQRGLIIAQGTSAATQAFNTAVISAGVGDAQVSCGLGSQAAIAVERVRGLDPTGEWWVGLLQDAGGSAAATGTLTFTGTATAASILPLYLDGYFVPVSVNLGDTASVIAGNTVTAANNFTTAGGNPLSFIAAAVAGAVTFTARNDGSLGNQSTIALSSGGTAQGQGQPGTTNVPGITAAIVAFSGGTTDPVLTTLLANLPNIPFDFIICPYSLATPLNALMAFLGDTAGRWNWSEQLFGCVFTAKSGTLSARTTWSTARNDQHASAIGAYNSPSPDWHWAVDYGAASAVSIRSDPAIPIGGIGGGVALNVFPPPGLYVDDFSEQETLLFDGLSTYIVGTDGTVYVSRAITTFQTNPAGAPSNAYLNVNVPFQLSAWCRAKNTMISSQYSQYGLVSDGTIIPPGLKRTTAQLIAQAIVGLYRSLCPSLMQNPDTFAANIQWQNAGGGVVKTLEPVMLANQLILVASDIQFTQP
jgi:phage tail sheath gpL-like